MYCENCGKQIEDGSKFCRYCGTKIDTTEILTDTTGRDEAAVIISENAEDIRTISGQILAAETAGMPEAGTVDKQKKIKRIVIAAAAAVLVIAFAVFIRFGIYNKPENRLARALALGQRYLLEENYEQAIVEFNRAIEIDPKNEEAYIGLAEAYVETDNLEKAVRILEKGAGKTDSDELQEMFEKYVGELARAEARDTAAEAEETETSELLTEDIEAIVPVQETNDIIVSKEEEPAAEAEELAVPVEEGTVETEATGQDSVGIRTERWDDRYGYTLSTYDGKGNLIKTERYEIDGTYSIDTYDAKGNEIKTECYNADGSLSRYYLYTFDSKGNNIKTEDYNADGSLSRYYLYIFDSNGNHIKTEHYNADGSLDHYTLFTYDSHGKKIQGEYNPDGSLR